MTQAQRPARETIATEGSRLLTEVKALLREGNVRRIVVRQDEQILAEFPLAVGVFGALFAPALAALGALGALLNDCTIEVERADTAPTTATTPPTERPGATPTIA